MSSATASSTPPSPTRGCARARRRAGRVALRRRGRRGAGPSRPFFCGVDPGWAAERIWSATGGGADGRRPVRGARGPTSSARIAAAFDGSRRRSRSGSSSVDATGRSTRSMRACRAAVGLMSGAYRARSPRRPPSSRGPCRAGGRAANRPVARLPLHRAVGSGKAAAARAFAAELLATGADDPDDARRRAITDPSPHPDLVWLAPARQPAPGRGRPPSRDRRRHLPAVRGDAPRLRDRGGRGHGGREPERAAEDARGTAAATPT